MFAFPFFSVVHDLQFFRFDQQHRGGRTLQFFDRELQISERVDCVLKSSILPLNSPKMGDIQPQILYFWEKIF